jgi:hypothetical protein
MLRLGYHPGMYGWALALHSWIRWLVIVAGAVAVLRAFAERGIWSSADERAGIVFTTILDVQVLLGLLLYLWLSPITAAARHDIGATMQNTPLRFWILEHPVGMIAAIALAHIGRARIRRAAPATKARTARIFFALALLLVLLSSPWPGLPYGRPLVRMP